MADSIAKHGLLLGIISAKRPSGRYHIEKDVVPKVLLKVGEFIRTYCKNRRHGNAFFPEMPGQVYESKVFLLACADNSDYRLAAALEAEVTPVAAGAGKLRDLYGLLPGKGLEQRFHRVNILQKALKSKKRPLRQ